jgi:hypothetical protein
MFSSKCGLQKCNLNETKTTQIIGFRFTNLGRCSLDSFKILKSFLIDVG